MTASNLSQTTDLVQCWIHVGSIAEPTDSDLLNVLNHEERLRAERYLRADARWRFVTGRVMLRELLAAELGLAPCDVPLILGDNGKPTLAGSQSLHFNVAHSHNAIAVALSKTLPVGVDLEYRARQFNFLPIARQFFSSAEADYLESMETQQALKHFYRLWTAREALLKGSGVGLLQLSPRFALPIEVATSARVSLNLQFDETKADVSNASGLWTFELSDISDDFVLAVASPGHAWNLLLRDYR